MHRTIVVSIGKRYGMDTRELANGSYDLAIYLLRNISPKKENKKKYVCWRVSVIVCACKCFTN
jgi:hypothetical protein